MMAFSALTMWTSAPWMACLATKVAMRPTTSPEASTTTMGRLPAYSRVAGGLGNLDPAMRSPDDPAVLALGVGLDGLLEGQDLAAGLVDLGLGGGARAEGDDVDLLGQLARAQQLAGHDRGLSVADVGVDLADVDLGPVARRLLQTGSDVSPQGSCIFTARLVERADELHEHRVRFAFDPGCHVVTPSTCVQRPRRDAGLSADMGGVYERGGKPRSSAWWSVHNRSPDLA